MHWEKFLCLKQIDKIFILKENTQRELTFFVYRVDSGIETKKNEIWKMWNRENRSSSFRDMSSINKSWRCSQHKFISKDTVSIHFFFLQVVTNSRCNTPFEALLHFSVQDSLFLPQKKALNNSLQIFHVRGVLRYKNPCNRLLTQNLQYDYHDKSDGERALVPRAQVTLCI